MSHAGEPVVTVPTRCPFCQSTAVTAAGQKNTASIYWRCEDCRQLWNPGRLLSVPRSTRDFPRR